MPPNPSIRVLVVDDDDSAVDMLKDYIEDMGLEPICTSNGMQALEVANREIPDVIILDLTMPKMDGFEVCTRLHAEARTREIPIIFLTATGDQLARVKGLEMGAEDFLHKPITYKEFKLRLASIVNRIQETKEIEDKSYQLGAVDVASRMQHFVGNKINTLNVHVGHTLKNYVRRLERLAPHRLVELLNKNKTQLPIFFKLDPRANHIIPYLERINAEVRHIVDGMEHELALLQEGLEEVGRIMAEKREDGYEEALDIECQVELIVREVMATYEVRCQQQRISLNTSFGEVPPVKVPRIPLSQVLNCVLHNAVESCSQERVLFEEINSNRVETKLHQEILITTSRENALPAAPVLLDIVDGGTVLDEADIHCLFQPRHVKYTKQGRKFEGLHISSTTLQRFGGNINMERDTHQAQTRVRLRLPVVNRIKEYPRHITDEG